MFVCLKNFLVQIRSMLGLVYDGFQVVNHHRSFELFEAFLLARLNASNTPFFAIEQSNVFSQNLDSLIFPVGHYFYKKSIFGRLLRRTVYYSNGQHITTLILVQMSITLIDW